MNNAPFWNSKWLQFSIHDNIFCNAPKFKWGLKHEKVLNDRGIGTAIEYRGTDILLMHEQRALTKFQMAT